MSSKREWKKNNKCINFFL